MQAGGGGGIRGPSVATPGASIQVEVRDGGTSVEVDLLGGNGPTSVPVGPDGKATIPVPPGSAGQVLYVVSNKKPKPSILRVEIIELN